MDQEIYMVTTEDNPYSPFTQFPQWRAFDMHKGYYTLEYLARVANTSSELSDEMNIAIANDAVNEIVALNVLGIYKRVTESDYKQ